MFSNVNKTFSQLVTKPCVKSTTWHNTWIHIINIVHRWISRCALCVIKSAIRHGMKFTWKYPDVWGLFLDGIAVFSREAGKRSTTGEKSKPGESRGTLKLIHLTVRLSVTKNFNRLRFIPRFWPFPCFSGKYRVLGKKNYPDKPSFSVFQIH